MAEESDNKGKKNWFKRHKVLTAILALIAIVIIGTAAGGDKTKNTSTTTPATSDANQSTNAPFDSELSCNSAVTGV